jgi:hypothetical protein
MPRIVKRVNMFHSGLRLVAGGISMRLRPLRLMHQRNKSVEEPWKKP